MKDLDYFKNEATNRGLCSQYADYWVSAANKQELFNLAMKYNSIRYIAKSMYEGWGMSVDFLCNEFKDFINRKGHSTQVIDGKEIKGLMFVGTRGFYGDTKADVFNIIACSGLSLKCENYATQYHINNDSSLSLTLPDDCHISIYLYDTSSVFIHNLDKQKVIIYDYRKEEDREHNAYKDKATIRNRDLYLDAMGQVQHKTID